MSIIKFKDIIFKVPLSYVIEFEEGATNEEINQEIDGFIIKERINNIVIIEKN